MANQHIVQRDNGWAVKGEGNKKATAIYQTQQEANGAAKIIAENQTGDVIIHGRDGKIRERNTYGKPDPFPPVG